jgi:hypothetical protein
VIERCRSEVPPLLEDGTGHATACHRTAELPAPEAIVPSDGIGKIGRRLQRGYRNGRPRRG